MRATFCSSQQTSAGAGNSQRRVRRLDGRIVNTASPTRMYGNVGQTNYGAAKASMVNFTMIANDELGGYDVTVNCSCRAARTRMIDTIRRRPSSATQTPQDGCDWADPATVSPLVGLLGSSEISGKPRTSAPAEGR